MPCDDCSRTEGCPPCVNDPKEPTASAVSSLSEAPLYEAAMKAHEEKQAAFQAVVDRVYEEPRCTWCGRRGASFEDCPEDHIHPPLTPEEEEEASAGEHEWRHATPSAGLTCVRCELAHKDWSGDECPAVDVVPPQPVRRPPYAVAYSVDGHLYEVALPGDATVQAVDGALVIKHDFGQVAGIVGIQPIDAKEAS